MTDYEGRASLWHAAALCLIAGFVDAIGYFELGHVFTANMTGNTVLLGAALAKGDWLALNYALTIAAFALGVVASTVLKVTRVAVPVLFLGAGAALVAIAIVRPSTLAALLALAFVMGLQGGAISTFSGIRLPTVVVTSTLVNLIDGLVRRQIGGASPPAQSAMQLEHLAAAWIAYGVGGAAAALAHGRVAMPLMAPAVLYGIVAMGLWWPRSR